MMRRLWTAVGVLLCLFSAALAEITPLPIDASPGLAYNWEKYGDVLHYEDPSLYIDVQEGELYGTRYMYAIVKIADPSQLRTAMAYKYNSNYVATAVKMADTNNAVLAINGDYYNYNDDGHLVRQGKVYRKRAKPKWDLLMIDQNGDFHGMHEPTKEKVADWQTAHPDLTIINSFNFGPVLMLDGRRVMDNFDEVANNFATRSYARFARMVLCQLDAPLTYLALCSQGDQDGEGLGFTFNELCDCLEALDAQLEDYSINVAYNMDGGYSTTMVLNGEKINSPDNGVCRDISDIVYFASAWTEE